MNETALLVIENNNPITKEKNDLNFVWVSTFCRTPVRFVRVNTLEEGNNILLNNGIEQQAKKLPFCYYSGEIFENWVSLSKTLKEELLIDNVSIVARKLQTEEGLYKIDDENKEYVRLTLNNDIIESQDGAKFTELKTSYDDDDVIQFRAWCIEKKRYVNVYHDKVKFVMDSEISLDLQYHEENGNNDQIDLIEKLKVEDDNS